MQSEFSCSRLTLNNFPKLKYNLLTFNSVGVTVKGRNIPSGRLNMYIDTMILITVDMNAKPAIILSDKSRKHSIIPFWSYGEISNIKLTLCFRDELLTGVFNCSFPCILVNFVNCLNLRSRPTRGVFQKYEGFQRWREAVWKDYFLDRLPASSVLMLLPPLHNCYFTLHNELGNDNSNNKYNSISYFPKSSVQYETENNIYFKFQCDSMWPVLNTQCHQNTNTERQTYKIYNRDQNIGF